MDKLIKLLEGTLSFLKRAILFLPQLIGALKSKPEDKTPEAK